LKLVWTQINHIEYVADIMRPPLPANATRLDRLKAAGDFDVNSPEAKKAVSFLVEHGNRDRSDARAV